MLQSQTKQKPSSLPAFNYVPPKLYNQQWRGIFNDSRYAVLECSTKSGKTYGCMVWLFEKALAGRRGHNFWWVAPIFSVAKIAFRRYKTTLPQGFGVINESELTITLPNGATIWFKGGDKPDSLYGEDVHAAVIDEASRCKEESWYAVRSTLTATKGPIRIIGNVKGRKNWAFKLARRAESGAANMSYAKITAYDAVDAGVLDQAEIDDAKATLPEDVFNELYLAIPTEDGSNPFGISAIQACVADLSNQNPVCWGIDLAKSHDYTVVVGLDASGTVCRFERYQKPWNDTVRDIRTSVKEQALVDSTGVGDAVLESLQDGRNNFEGFKFTSTSKQQLMEGLRLAIQQQDVRFPDGVIVSELESFEFTYTRTGVRYSAPEGEFDDCVCALALAVLQYKNRFEVSDRERQAFAGISL
jgi:hypothetical protein